MAMPFVLPMMRNQTMKSWRSAEQWLLGGMVLALAAAAFIWLVLGPAPAAPAHLTAVVLLIASLLASLIMMRRVGTTRRQMEAVLHGRARAEQHAIEALRHSEAQWKEVFEHNPVMYFMVDAAGTVLSVNTFGAAQLGYSVSELLGQSVLKVFPADEQHAAQSNVAICLENIGQTHSWEICKVRKDGSSLWVRENAKAVRRLDNQLIVLIACEDVTERKEAENALRQSEMYLAEAQRLSRTGSFGWRVARTDSGHRMLEHGGAWQGFASYIARYPDDRLTVAVLCNRAGARAGYIAKRVAGLYLPVLVPRVHSAVKLDGAILNSYAGDYRLEDRFTIKVSLAGDRLETTWLGEKIAMIPESEVAFFEEDSDRTFRFVKNNNGVKALVISVPEELTLSRLP